MLFNSIHFLVFFPVVLFLYFVLPKKCRSIVLLIASYYFYMSWNPTYALLILFSTASTFLGGILLTKAQEKQQLKKAKVILGSVIAVNLAILFTFKYLDFAISNLNTVLSALHIQIVSNPFDFLLPVGISFYTFQALGYIIDVYRKDIETEKNFLQYALFVSFFPQLVAGPIERSGNLLRQIRNVDKIKVSYKNITNGLVIMLWGFFMKMVVADRIAVVANYAFDNYWKLDSFALIVGAIAFAIQIYCDFASYSTIAIGAAKVMGFELMENFNTPYCATSIKDFWSRWHISLSTFFKDYLYFPLGGNRKGKKRTYLNLFIVFLVSGLWHGANWTFIFWGALHGIYQIVGRITLPTREKLYDKAGIDRTTFSFKFFRIVFTFILVDLAWIFFRANTISEAFGYISRIFTQIDLWSLFNGSIYTLGLNRPEMNLLILSVVVLYVVDMLRYRKGLRLDQALEKENIFFRWLVIFAILFAVIIFGAYGVGFDAQDFIYFQF
ncbi:MAG: MBOAT family protein [Ruminococcaceae bacterium]|nr:MBOAT family protein [Oscillospiraceae bacterium]